MLKELQDLGLSEKEAGVYLAALEIGRATADQLAKHARLVRPTTYLQLKSLMEKGLMSTYEEGKKTYFAPESPAALSRVLEQQKEALRTSENLLAKLLPDLTRQFEGAGERPVVRFFEGKEGISTMRKEALQAKNKAFLVIYNHDKLAELYTPEERAAYSKERSEKGIALRSLYVAEKRKNGPERPNSNFRYLPTSELPLTSDILIYDDRVGISALAHKPFAILIRSKEMAESFRAFFELMWKFSGSISNGAPRG